MKRLYVLFLLFAAAPVLFSQNEVPSEKDVNVEWVQNRQKRIEESQLAEEDKKKIVEIYNQVLDNIKSYENFLQREKEFSNHTSSASAKEAEFKAKISALEKELELPLFARAAFKDLTLTQITVASLENKLTQIKLEADDTKKDSTKLQEEVKYRNDRRLEIPRLLLEIKKNIESYQLTNERTNDLQVANNMLAMTVRRSLVQEHVTYEREIASYDARNTLITLRKEYLVKKYYLLEQSINALTNEIAQRKKIQADEAAQQAKEALRNVIQSHPVIGGLIKENSELTEIRKKILKKITAENDRLVTLERQLKEIQRDISITKEKEVAAHLTNVMGILLRQQLNNLPEVHINVREIAKREYELPATQLSIIELEEKLLDMANFEQKKAKYAVQFAQDAINAQQYLQTLHEVLTNRKEYLESLVKDYNTYLSKLIDLDTKERLYINVVSEFRRYIEERIFWVRSTDAIKLRDIKRATSGFLWLFSPSNWWSLVSSLYNDFQNNMFLYILFVIAIGYLIFLRWSIHQRLADITKLVSKRRTDQFKHTLYVCFYTLIFASTIPATMWMLGWRLEKANPLFAVYVSSALKATAQLYFAFSLSYAIVLANGLGEAHFKWNSVFTEFLRKHIIVFMWLIIPVYFCIFTLENHGVWQDSLGRVLVCIAMTISAIFFYGIFKRYKSLYPPLGKLILKAIYNIAYISTVILPFFFILISFLGYHYAAVRLSEKLLQTVTVCLVIFYCGKLFVRWLEVVYHKFSYLQRKSKSKNKEQSEQPQEVENAEEINLEEFMKQGKYLLSILMWCVAAFFLWNIWRDVLPALKILDRVILWSYTVPGGEEVTSLQDLIFAVFFVVFSGILAKNLPGLLEVYFLQKIKLENGVSFAISTLIRHFLVATGILLACQSMGLTWGKVQWLVAAFSVGLGFGLQEIFANFVAGLIILFERPMRVGDIVTIGDTSGSISKIKIRATTITDWDRKELIVPNKEFITGRLVNWSLSDTILRVVVNVGVAYGSDVDRVREILLRVANDNPNILKNEKITVVFDKFGDNALNFSLRVFVPNISVYLQTINGLHIDASKALKDAGIEIAFPQRDIHIRSIKGGDLSKVIPSQSDSDKS